MSAPISSIQEVVYIKTQAAVGTGETIDQTTDPALRVISCTFTRAGDGKIRRANVKSATGIESAPVMGGLRWDIALEVECFPFSSYTNVASSPLSPLLRACGQLSLLTTPNRVKYRVKAGNVLGTDLLPLTIERHEIGGNRYRATDVVGTLTGVTMEANKPITLSFTLQGLWSTPVESTFTMALTNYVTAQVPMVFQGATIVSGLRESDGTTPQQPIDLRLAALTFNTSVTERPNTLSGNVEGYSPSFVTRAGGADQVAFSCTAGPEGDAAGDTSVWANWLGNASGRSFSLEANEGSGGAKLTVEMAEVYYDTPTPSTAMPYREYDLVAFGVDRQSGANYSGMELTFAAGT